MIRLPALRTTGLALAISLLPLLPAHAAPATPAAAAEAPANRQLKQLVDDYYQAAARFEPLMPTFSGDNRFDDQLGLSIAPKNRAAYAAQRQAFANRLKAIKQTGLNESDRISYAILDYELAVAKRGEQFPDHLLTVGADGGFPLYLANLASGDNSQPIRTPEQYRVFLKRLSQLTPWLDQSVANMREGLRTGIVQPAALIVTALPMYEKMVSKTAKENLFYAAVKAMPAGVPAAERSAIEAAYTKEIETRLIPALTRIASFLKNEYLPKARTTAGLGALKNGQAWYAHMAAVQTTSTLTPDQIHEMGLKEVARIQAQFAELGPRLGYTGPAAGLPKWVGAQEKFRPFTDDQQILAFYRDLDTKIGPKLPALFSLTPKAPLEQRLEPELTRASASDHYTPPDAAGTRPGVFWSVVTDARQYDSTRMTSLLLHEGRPGHHFQIALQMEQPLPDFRKFGGYNAYVEGWALYAETLGKELGVFEEPAPYFGHLNSELLRAVRLVVDTGLHAKGWSREKAMDYMRETNGYSEAVAKTAIERYMSWPGQALGYKIGAIKISELRQRASKELGPKFSLPAFHAVVLEQGAMPLAVLEDKVNRWIAATR